MASGFSLGPFVFRRALFSTRVNGDLAGNFNQGQPGQYRRGWRRGPGSE
jgi:hypothetical protein